LFLRPGNLLVVKICDRDIEYFGQPLQPPGADTVGAFFVFLHLLKRQPEGIGDGRLRNTEVEPPYFKAATDFTIRGGRTSLAINSPLALPGRLANQVRSGRLFRANA